LSLVVWRISKKKYVATAFSGEGARRVSGRWHSRGTGLVYTSASLALSSLELFVHLEIEDIGTLFAALPAEIPEQVPIEVLEESQLPVGWRSSPPPAKLAEIGDEWFRARRTAVLAVPSAVIPREKNYLLNPEHPDFQSIRIGPAEDFVLDPRLWKSM
jgi:RES domain-containing protein